MWSIQEAAEGEKQAFAGLTSPKRAGPRGDKVSKLATKGMTFWSSLAL